MFSHRLAIAGGVTLAAVLALAGCAGESETAGELCGTNVVPKQMTHDELLAGVKWLCNKLYEPRAYWTRVLRMVEQMDREGFGNCTNHGACQKACPKEISVRNISMLNREFAKAVL